jgi:hypothetical protein
MRSKLNESQRDSVIMLSGMLYQRNPNWLEIKSDDIIDKNSKQMSNGQLLALIVHLTCAEIRLILDDTEKIIVENRRLDTLLPLCYNTIEKVVQILVYDSESTLNLDYSLLESIRTAMRETFLAVIAFLVERYDFYTLEGESSLIDNPTCLLSLRAYSVWVSEETEGLSEELERLIPLVTYFIDCKPKGIENDPMIFLTPLLTNITSDNETVEFFINLKGHEKIINWLLHQKEIKDDLMVAINSILINIVISCPKLIVGNSFQSLLFFLIIEIENTSNWFLL